METLKYDKEKGRSMTEYAVILAMVTLVTIPSVSFLGNSLSNMLAGPKESDYKKLISILEPNDKTSSLPTTTTTTPDAGSSIYTDFQTNGGTINLTSGSLTLPGGTALDLVTQSGQGGNDTAVLATSILADQMLALADEMDADGAPSDLIALLRDAAGFGHDLANAEESWNSLCSDPGNCAANPNTGGDPNQEVYNAHWQFTDTSNQLLTKFKVDYASDLVPGSVMDNFFQLSYQYTTGIDEVGGVLYSKQVAAEIGKVDGFGQAEIPSTNSGLDFDTSGITLDIAPQFTETTSTRLEAARQEALETALAQP